MKLSVIILTKDCVEELPICLGEMSFADEIIVVDGDSTDGTLNDITKYELPIKVVHRTWNDNFCDAWKFGESFATGDWTLWWGSDEAATKEFSFKIHTFLESVPACIDYVRFSLIDLVLDEKHYFRGSRDTMIGFLWNPHLFRKGKSICQSLPDGTEHILWDSKKSVFMDVVAKVHYKFLSERRLRRKIWKPEHLELLFPELVKAATLYCPGMGDDIKDGRMDFGTFIGEVPQYIEWNKLGVEGLKKLRLEIK